MAEEIFIKTEDGQGLEALTPALKETRFPGMGELFILGQNPPQKIVYSGEEADQFEAIMQAMHNAALERAEDSSR